jgi:hypothetical protein
LFNFWLKFEKLERCDVGSIEAKFLEKMDEFSDEFSYEFSPEFSPGFRHSSRSGSFCALPMKCE